MNPKTRPFIKRFVEQMSTISEWNNESLKQKQAAIKNLTWLSDNAIKLDPNKSIPEIAEWMARWYWRYAILKSAGKEIEEKAGGSSKLEDLIKNEAALGQLGRYNKKLDDFTKDGYPADLIADSAAGIGQGVSRIVQMYKVLTDFIVKNRDDKRILSALRGKEGKEGQADVPDNKKFPFKLKDEAGKDLSSHIVYNYINNIQGMLSDMEKLIKGVDLVIFPDKWRWADLQTSYCKYEGEAMRHCGNIGNISDDISIYALRTNPDEEAPVGVPVLTFTVAPNDKAIYEMKGNNNTTPGSQYWDKVIELLGARDKNGQYLVQILTGGAYGPGVDFNLNRLSLKQLQHLYKLNPQLVENQYIYDPDKLKPALSTLSKNFMKNNEQNQKLDPVKYKELLQSVGKSANDAENIQSNSKDTEDKSNQGDDENQLGESLNLLDRYLMIVESKYQR